MNKLILTVGLPRSGKSTWAKETGFPVVSPDAIRLALHGQRFETLAEPMVWAITKIMVRALFLTGSTTVVLDSTNTTKKRRNTWLSKDWEIAYEVFTTSAEECKRRARMTAQDDLCPIIDMMATNWDGELTVNNATCTIELK
ncbi:MAG: AAA family ATPase [Bacteroidales bacterium]|nr:AAA family ATPase [Candidatus Latescibacterota bacterium]